MDRNVCFIKTAARRRRMGAMPWLRRLSRPAGTVVVAALALLLTGGAPQASAGARLYPGEMCIKWTGAGIPKYYFGNIGNESTTAWLYLDCPMVTDSHGQGAYDVAGIGYRDLHPSFDVSCTLYKVANDGPNGEYFVVTDGTFHSTGATYEPQGSMNLWQDGIGKDRAWSYFSCAIPPAYANSYRSYLLYYYLEE